MDPLRQGPGSEAPSTSDSSNPSNTVLKAFGVAKGCSQNYLCVVTVGVVLAQLLLFLRPNWSLFGQSPFVTVPLVAVLIAVVLWFGAASEGVWSISAKLILILMAGYWLIAVASLRLDGDAFNYAVWVTPVLLLMLWQKPLCRASILRSADAYAWAVVSAAIIAQVAHWVGLARLREEFPMRLAPLQILGAEYRWEGPFQNVNFVGPLAAFLFVYGVLRGRRFGIAFAIAGIVLMAISDSRGGLIAAGCGLAVGLIFAEGKWARPRWLQITVFVAALLAPTAILLISGGNGRRDVWLSWIEELVPGVPLTGYSSQDLSTAIVLGKVPDFATHGHNWFVQTVVDQGPISLIFVLMICAVAVIAAWRSSRLASPLGAAIVVTFLAASANEDLYLGTNLNIQVLPFVLGALLACQDSNSRAGDRSHRSIQCRGQRGALDGRVPN